MGGVEGSAELAGGVCGVGEVGGGPVDDPAGVDVVVGPDSAGVLFGGQPAGELSQKLREPTGQHDEFGDDPVELGRSDQRRPALGLVVQFADRFGRGRGDGRGGWGSGTGHGWGSPLTVVVRSVG
jgi:hypothetical protein